MKGFGKQNKFNNKKKSDFKTNQTNTKLLNQALIFQSKGNISEAKKYYKYLIDQGFEDYRLFANFGLILVGINRFKEAELYTRKAISLDPNFAMAHCNLGSILIDVGKLEDAKLSLMQSISLNPNLCRSYVSLSNLKYEKKNQHFLNTLFSKSILKNSIKKDQIDIFFARANILHKEKKFKESAENLKLANNLKLSIYPSETNIFINKSASLHNESKKLKINQQQSINYPQSIFIVGMPRSGSTLVESILSMNSDVYDLGEINIFEKSFLEWKKENKKKSLNNIYQKKITKDDNKYKITTNKWLYNYQYAGIIANEIFNSKIIYCFRNPLDNILSIYRAHFARGNTYSSSLVDCAKIYLDQKQIMTKYQNEFGSKIYKLNYDLLVSDYRKEIKSLVCWLGWKWNDSYLSPHLSKRSISTRSNVEVRSPINSKSVGGWKNYKDMLKPAIEIINRCDEYQETNEN